MKFDLLKRSTAIVLCFDCTKLYCFNCVFHVLEEELGGDILAKQKEGM